MKVKEAISENDVIYYDIHVKTAQNRWIVRKRFVLLVICSFFFLEYMRIATRNSYFGTTHDSKQANT